MMNIRKLIAVTCLLVASTMAWADYEQELTINGETVDKVVTSITFDGDNAVLHFADETTEVADMDAVVLTLKGGTQDAIYSLRQEVTDMMTLSGLAPDTEIVVFDASGKSVIKATAAQTQTILQTATLKNGVYMLRAGNKTVKFIKR